MQIGFPPWVMRLDQPATARRQTAPHDVTMLRRTALLPTQALKVFGHIVQVQWVRWGDLEQADQPVGMGSRLHTYCRHLRLRIESGPVFPKLHNEAECRIAIDVLA